MTDFQTIWWMNGQGHHYLDALFFAALVIAGCLFVLLSLLKPRSHTAGLKRVKAASYFILVIYYAWMRGSSGDLIISMPAMLGYGGIAMADIIWGCHRLIERKREDALKF